MPEGGDFGAGCGALKAIRRQPSLGHDPLAIALHVTMAARSPIEEHSIKTVTYAVFGLALAVPAFALTAGAMQAFEAPALNPAPGSAIIKVYGQDEWLDREERRLRHEEQERREWRERQEERARGEREWRDRHERCEHVASVRSERHGYSRYEYHERLERHDCAG
jgi:hypothetical protein